MANTLQDTINFCSPFVRYMPLAVGTNNAPAIPIANLVRNVILSAPFTWRFNRNTTTFTTTQGTQDYTKTAFTTLGFLEAASTTDVNSKIFQMKDVFNTEVSSLDAGQGRPQSTCVFSQNSSGDAVFRLLPVPDATYTVTLTYQQAPVLFSSLSDAWAPVPDAFSDIYNNLCLGYFVDYCQDPRAASYIARGGAALLAKAEGLSQMDKAIFMASFLNLDAAQIVNTLQAQQGVNARAAR